MAVLFATGFEIGDLAYYNNWPPSMGRIAGISSLNRGYSSSFEVVQYDTLHKRVDGSGGKVSAFASGSIDITFLPGTPRWVHGWYRKRDLDASSSCAIEFTLPQGGQQSYVLFDSDGTVKIQRSTTVLATSVDTIDPFGPLWFAIEVVVDNSSGLVRVYIGDSVTPIVEVTGADTQLQASSDFGGVRYGTGVTNRTFWDDLIITDAATGRIAESYAVLGRPVSNQSVALTPSVGTNWENVRPASESDGFNPASISRYNEARGIPRGYASEVTVLETDPDTAAAWQPSAFNTIGNVAVGLKAVT